MQNHPMHQYRLGTLCLGGTPTGKGLGVPADTAVQVQASSMPSSEVRQATHSYVRAWPAGWRKFFFPLTQCGLTLWHQVLTPPLPPSWTGICRSWKRCSWATKTVKGLKLVSYIERLRKLNLFGLARWWSNSWPSSSLQLLEGKLEG